MNASTWNWKRLMNRMLWLLVAITTFSTPTSNLTAAPPDGFDPSKAYASSCSVCHGIHGNAKTTVAASMVPPPADFSSPESRMRLTPELIVEAITKGKKGTAMPGWAGRYSKNEIKALATYINNTFMTARDAPSPKAVIDPQHIPSPYQNRVEMTAEPVPAKLPTPTDGEVNRTKDKLCRIPMLGDSSMSSNHPGLPFNHMLPVLLFIPVVILWALWSQPREPIKRLKYPLTRIPLVASLVRILNAGPYPLAALKILTTTAYLLVMVAGYWGTSTAEHNFATVLVWGLWWPLVIISVFFVGSAWCAICPWDTLARLVVFRRLWRRPAESQQSNRRVPAALRNVYPALFLFLGLTWLELGMGVTTLPQATAGMALLMFVLAAISLILFERRAFCRYFCPVGRTIGYYSRLAPIEIRPVDDAVCARCTTLECYNGTPEIEPCPTHLTLGRFGQNTFCISCSSCVLSCPDKNVTWRLRSMASEAIDVARPHWDGAWFMIGLLAITLFHGMTMRPFWGEWITAIAAYLGESDPPLITFTLLLTLTSAVMAALYALAIMILRLLTPETQEFKPLFSRMAFVNLPLAFSDHLAHNLEHIFRETPDLSTVLANPLGTGSQALSAMERHQMIMAPAIPDWMIFSMQSLLMAFGFWIAVQIIRHRTRGAMKEGGTLTGIRALPMMLYAALITCFSLWLLGQEMVMRL